MKYYSQIEQDKYYIEHVNNNKKNGFFVDVGAHNGISFSNTKTLEDEFGWDGICIEADDTLYKELTKNRKCTCVNEVVYNISGKEVELETPLHNNIPEGNDMLIRIKGYKHNANYFASQFLKTKSIKRTTKTLTEILDQQNSPTTIDYLSVDVEGAEFDVLKGLDFKKYTVKFITVEWGLRKNFLSEIKQFMLSKGFLMHRINNFDVEFCCPAT